MIDTNTMNQSLCHECVSYPPILARKVLQGDKP